MNIRRILDPRYIIEIYTESTEKSIEVLKVLYNCEVKIDNKYNYVLDRMMRNIEYSNKNSLNRIRLSDMNKDTSKKLYDLIREVYPELRCIKRRSW